MAVPATDVSVDLPITVTNSVDLETLLNTDLPVLLYLWSGNSTPPDVRTVLEATAKDFSGRIRVIKADISHSPEIATVFEVGKHPMIIGLLRGETLIRRNRPWGTDVQGVVDLLTPYAPVESVMAVIEKAEVAPAVFDKPVKVSDQTFEVEVIQSELPVLVDFWAAWCGPCRQIAPILDKLALEFAGQIKIAKVDVDANPGLSQVFGIQSIPTLMAVKSGKIVFQQAGALPEVAFRQLISQLLALQI